ncbi:MAG: 2-octaprenyl-6-methoxyphenyl hydroxylase [Gammaproteobacteria bacterium]
MRTDYDILIVGGGLAGNCLALALKNSGLAVGLIEARTTEELYHAPAGDRALALAEGTVTQLKALGVWQGIEHTATPIREIHVSDRGHFGKTRLSAQKEGVAALGYVITARDIESHVAHLVERADIERICPARVEALTQHEGNVVAQLAYRKDSLTTTARLAVGADGGQSTLRGLLGIESKVIEYGQTALVTTVNCTLPHRNTAYERFTGNGPLAMLPVGKQQCAVVWTRTHAQAETLMAADDDAFIKQLQQCFGYRLGELDSAAPRRSFPLTLVRAGRQVKGRTVLIGNAVHQLHPVAGQGFNLGLRDVVLLAEMLLERHDTGLDIGAADFLKHYVRLRQQDLNHVVGFTDGLVRLFSNELAPLAFLRNAGLTLLDMVPLGKTVMARHAMGLSGRLPRLGARR